MSWKDEFYKLKRGHQCPVHREAQIYLIDNDAYVFHCRTQGASGHYTNRAHSGWDVVKAMRGYRWDDVMGEPVAPSVRVRDPYEDRRSELYARGYRSNTAESYARVYRSNTAVYTIDTPWFEPEKEELKGDPALGEVCP